MAFSFLVISIAIHCTGFQDDAPAPNFVLKDVDGHEIALKREPQPAMGTIIAFTSVECPIARAYLPRLVELSASYVSEGFRFLAVNPNFQDSIEEIQGHAKAVGVSFPILRDPYQQVADLLDVKTTTEVLLLDREYRIVYRGALDDQHGLGTKRDAPLNDYLIDAIECLIEEMEIEVQRTEAPGSLIAHLSADKVLEDDVTFHRDVAPILYVHCVECHRDGEIGPMELIDYREVRGWAPMIAEVVSDGRMPPWHANPRYGQFSNVRRLNELEKGVIKRWVDIGAPEGSPKMAPPKPTYDGLEWSIGTPDKIFELPEVQEIPATGTVPYRYVTVDTELTEDKWVGAIEVKPGNPEVLHHVIAFLIPPGSSVGDVLRQSELGQGSFTGYAPGARPEVYSDGLGKLLPAGSKLLLQLHYTTCGVESTDSTRIGVRWARHDVEYEVTSGAVANFRLDIPPGESGVTYEATTRIDDFIQVLGLSPHLHARGAAFRFDLIQGSKREVLLDVPKFDFNWQHTYKLTKPLYLSPGDQIHVTAVYDNSKENPSNPDPTKRVRWGDQTWDEMMIGYYDYIKKLPEVDQSPK